MQEVITGNFLKVEDYKTTVECWINIKKISEIRKSENNGYCYIFVDEKRYIFDLSADELVRTLFHRT
jgi:hypothetical protein